MPAPASADTAECNDAFCTPGITAGVELGAPCSDTSYYVFGVDTRNGWGFDNTVAQAPDGLFLTCGIDNHQSVWVRGDA